MGRRLLRRKHSGRKISGLGGFRADVYLRVKQALNRNFDSVRSTKKVVFNNFHSTNIEHLSEASVVQNPYADFFFTPMNRTHPHNLYRDLNLKMKRISEFKIKYKDILQNILPQDEKEAFTQHNVVNVLTNRDQKGRRVLLVNVGGSWDTSKVTSDQLFRLFYLIHVAAVLEPESQVRGVVVIMDFDNLTRKQVAALSPSFSIKLLSFIQDAMPLRLKEVHMVKQPFIFNIVWQIFKPFIREKLKKRIFFHGHKMPSLHKYLEPSFLPEDYGGELPKIDYTGAEWFPCIENHIEHYRTWNSFGAVKT